MARRVLLALNPRARRARSARERVARAFAERGHHVVEVALDRAAEGLSRAIVAHRHDVDVVVVGGGDGTLLSAIDGLIATRLPLAVLPLGTFNELARTLGIPADPAAVAALVDDGVPFPLDVGVVNGVRYFNEASVGLSTRVARLQTGEVKSRLGMLAIPVTTVRALGYSRPMHLEITFDDGSTRRIRALQLTVANNYRFGGVIENPEASLEDGRLWLYAVDVPGPLHAAALLASIPLHRFQRAPNVLAVKGNRFHVRSVHGHAHRVFADSEDVARLPAEFGIVPQAVRVLVPADRLSDIR